MKMRDTINLVEAKKPYSDAKTYQQVQAELRDTLAHVKYLRARLRQLEPKDVKSLTKRVAKTTVERPIEPLNDPFLDGIRNRGKPDWPLR